MPWQPEIDELRRKRLAQAMGGADKVKRQHDGGRLTVRERIDRLVDQGSFREIGSIAGKAEYDGRNDLVDLMPANVVMGRAQDRRPACRGDRRRLHGARRLGRRHDQGKGHLHRALRQPVSRAADPHDRGLGRRRLGQDHRDHRPRQRAGRAAAGRWVVQQHGHRADGRRWASARSRASARRGSRPRTTR